MKPLLAALALFAAAPSAAWACATVSIEIENRTGRTVNRLAFEGDAHRGNQAPRGGLPRGQTVTIVVPGCVDYYTLVAVLDDGTTRSIPGIPAVYGRRFTLD